MSDDTSGDMSPDNMQPHAGTDWARLRAQTDADIHRAILDDPDATPTDAAFWDDARVVMPKRKETVTIRLDADVLGWFRGEKGYQTKINAILRAYMAAHQHPR